jgi:hypothetical protein
MAKQPEVKNCSLRDFSCEAAKLCDYFERNEGRTRKTNCINCKYFDKESKKAKPKKDNSEKSKKH